MHKGWAPQPFTTCKWTRVGGPQPLTTWGGRAPQPFTTCKFANGQGLGPPPTLHDLQMDKGWASPPTLHDLQIDKGWGPPGPPNPSRLANKQGLGTPTLHDLQMDKGWAPQPFTTCKWTRVGAPNPSRLGAAGHPNPSRHANGQGLGPPPRVGGPQPLTTWGGRAPNASGLRRWSPQPFTTWGGGPPTLHQRSANQ